MQTLKKAVKKLSGSQIGSFCKWADNYFQLINFKQFDRMVDRLSSNLLLASVAEFIKSRVDIWNKVPFCNYSAVCTKFFSLIMLN